MRGVRGQAHRVGIGGAAAGGRTGEGGPGRRRGEAGGWGDSREAASVAAMTVWHGAAMSPAAR